MGSDPVVRHQTSKTYWCEWHPVNNVTPGPSNRTCVLYLVLCWMRHSLFYALFSVSYLVLCLYISKMWIMWWQDLPTGPLFYTLNTEYLVPCFMPRSLFDTSFSVSYLVLCYTSRKMESWLFVLCATDRSHRVTSGTGAGDPQVFAQSNFLCSPRWLWLTRRLITPLWGSLAKHPQRNRPHIKSAWHDETSIVTASTFPLHSVLG